MSDCINSPHNACCNRAICAELLEALEEMTNAAADLVAGKPVRDLDERLLRAARVMLQAKGEA